MITARLRARPSVVSWSSTRVISPLGSDFGGAPPGQRIVCTDFSRDRQKTDRSGRFSDAGGSGPTDCHPSRPDATIDEFSKQQKILPSGGSASAIEFSHRLLYEQLRSLAAYRDHLLARLAAGADCPISDGVDQSILHRDRDRSPQ